MKYLSIVAMGVLSLVMAAPRAQAQPQYPNGYYQTQNWRAALSAQDQQEFDKHYTKWVDATRKNDRDDIAKEVGKMQEIMSRNNIPSNVSFDQIANGTAAVYPANPNAAYPTARMSGDDQQNFDKAYAKWVDAQRKNDQDDVAENAGKMQQIMSRNGIPSNVPFAAIATNAGYASPAPVAVAPYPYVPQATRRLSADDQKDFDKAYREWVKARNKRDMDDVDKHARKMEDIMARYNIPANVSFDQIVSPGGAYR